MSQIGVTGLAVMGANLARNIARRGVPIAVHNRTASKTEEFLSEFSSEGDFTGSESLEEFVSALERPRRIIVMVKAGAPVDGVIESLEPLLDEGDIIIDAGNSHFADTRRREAAATEKGLRFIGTGVSGGEEGALNGPSIMPGGPPEAYSHVEEIFTTIAAQVDGEPCCAYIGADGAGHYVKMVHNGIEYADMQLIAEAYDLLRHGVGLDVPTIKGIFDDWNAGDLESFLIEITATVLDKTDESTGKPLVDVIVDQAEQKGTGRWTSQDALELGVPLTGITEAVFARSLSALRDQRKAASSVLAGPQPGGLPDSLVDDIRAALYASKVVAYAQGFEQMAAAAKTYSWDLQMGELAKIWRGGCIIRARFLNRITDSYADTPDLVNLLMAPYFRDEVAKAQDAWRKVIVSAVEQGIAVPAFSSSLAYYDGYRRERGPANLIQGQRDFFGAHTYRRVDKEGSFHTRWSQDGTEVQNILILLPPSEGKTAPSSGDPVDLGSLAFPGLNKTRERLLDVLARLKFPGALKYLDVGPGLLAEAQRNLTLRAAPAAPASTVYTGVLYEHLGPFEADNVLIASGLWGFVRANDRIPAYRLSIGATLPRIPNLAALWRDPLRRSLPDEGLIVDMRSGGYVNAWKPKHATVVGVRAFHQGKTVSHMVKATRGDVARVLLGHSPTTPDEVVEIVRAAGLNAELNGSNLDVIS